MKITVEDSDNREKILHIEVDDDRLEKHVKKANRHHGFKSCGTNKNRRGDSGCNHGARNLRRGARFSRSPSLL